MRALFIMTLADAFSKRFAGLPRAHGRYKVPTGIAPGKKRSGRGETIREPVSVELWQAHLDGIMGLGIVPIRDDGHCVFGAIDVDRYDLDLKALEAAVLAAGFPLVVCRTKSGGAHLWLFTNEDVPAELMRGRLMEWAVALGHSGVEVFPKQTRLAGVNDVGSWINMPYFAHEETDRYAIDHGEQLSAEEFLTLADQRALLLDALEGYQLPTDDLIEEWFLDAPPCLQTLAKRRFGEGMRNNALFNVGVYLRKRFGDQGWEAKLDEYNQRFMDPPLGHKEVAQIVRNVAKKDYIYTCSQPPIVAVCNKQICLTRTYGIGQGENDPGVVFGQLVKINTEPPLWIWDVDGARIELHTPELKDQGRFQTRCMDVLNKWPNTIKPGKWAELVRDKLATVEVQEAPPEASPRGQVWYMLESYCTGHTQARSKEELLLCKPWTDPDTNKTWFSGSHFKKWLDQQRFHCYAPQLWAWLRSFGAEHTFTVIKGKGRNFWMVRAFAEQSEPFGIPELPEEQL